MNLKKLIDVVRFSLAETGLDRLPDGRVNQRVDARVVRFLRQAGIVSPPDGHGPGAVWGTLHHEQILTCRALQMDGVSLAEAAEIMRGKDVNTLQKMRARLLDAHRNPVDAEPVHKCPSWQIGDDFILVNIGGRKVSPASILVIHKLLYE